MDNTDIGQRFVNGGEDELEEIINLYGQKLLRYATAILCDHHEAENVVQEVFISIYKNRTTFDGNNLSSWLYKITYNRSLNQLKKRKLFYFSEIHGEVVLPEEDKGMSDEVLSALQRLKPKERALLYGRIMEELSYDELSQLIGSSPATLRKRYQRAKKKLAGYLTAKHYGKEPRYEQI